MAPGDVASWSHLLTSGGVGTLLAIGLVVVAVWGLRRERRVDAMAEALLEVVKSDTAATVELRASVEALRTIIAELRSDLRERRGRG